jgi:hypothetical protein
MIKTVFLGCGCLTLLLVLGVAGAGWLGWKTFQTMPADAKREVLFKANRSLIERIDAVIVATDKLDDLSRNLAAAITDQRVLYLAVHERESGWKQDAIKRLTWDSHSTSTFNGAGWGTLSGKFESHPIRIIESHAALRDGRDITYTIYLDHPQQVEKQVEK